MASVSGGCTSSARLLHCCGSDSFTGPSAQLSLTKMKGHDLAMRRSQASFIAQCAAVSSATCHSDAPAQRLPPQLSRVVRQRSHVPRSGLSRGSPVQQRRAISRSDSIIRRAGARARRRTVTRKPGLPVAGPHWRRAGGRQCLGSTRFAQRTASGWPLAWCAGFVAPSLRHPVTHDLPKAQRREELSSHQAMVTKLCVIAIITRVRSRRAGAG